MTAATPNMWRLRIVITAVWSALCALDAAAQAPPAPQGRGGGRGGATPVATMTKGDNGVWAGTTVRPEKIWFATSGLAGKVRTRIFQGNHWLYQIETADGLVTVIRQNTGEAMPAEGAAVHLAWAAV